MRAEITMVHGKLSEILVNIFLKGMIRKLKINNGIKNSQYEGILRSVKISVKILIRSIVFKGIILSARLMQAKR